MAKLWLCKVSWHKRDGLVHGGFFATSLSERNRVQSRSCVRRDTGEVDATMRIICSRLKYGVRRSLEGNFIISVGSGEELN